MYHVIKRGPVKDLDECEYRCYLDPNCVSLNIKNKDHDSGTHECELNNSTRLEHDGDLKDNQLYYYRGAEVSDHHSLFFLTFCLQLFNEPIYTKDNGHITSSKIVIFVHALLFLLKSSDKISILRFK